MNLTALVAVVSLLNAFVLATASITYSTTENHADNSDGGGNINDEQRPNNRHLLESNSECVLYLKNVQYEDGHGEDSWSCEFPPEISNQFGGISMMDIKGVSKEELDSRGAVSGESIIRVDSSAYIETTSPRSYNENIVFRIPKNSGYEIKMLDWKIDIRHARNRRDRLQRQRRLDPNTNLLGSLGTLKVLVVRVIDGVGRGPDANAEELQKNIFTGDISLKSQFAACSHDQVIITQTTEVSTILDNNETVPGIVDVHVNTLAKEGNQKMIEYAAVAAANNTCGGKSSLAELFDLVMFCQPPGTGDWLAYAYVNDWRSFYNNEWCQRVSAQMHEVGHNLNLAHSGLPNDSVYADKSGMMGFSYSDQNGPIQCFNAAKSYQLGWYSAQTSSINPLDFIGNSQTFILNGISNYRKDGQNGDALVSLRLEHEGSDGGVDYYIGYNRKNGCNSGTTQAPNRVTLLEKDNPYATSDGPDGYGLSRRIAALKAGKSTTIKNYAGSTSDVTLKVNYIKGKKASITISTSPPEPSQAPTICGGNSLKIEVGTDSFGSETRWYIKDKDTNRIVIQSTEGYFSNTVYELPSPTSSYCVTPGKCYIFTITDKAGDGMCCDYGLGFFRGFLEGIKIFEGGTFRAKDSIEFCVPSGDDDEFLVRTNRPSMLSTRPPIATSRPTINPDEYPSTSPSMVPTKEPIAEPSNLPSVSPSVSPSQVPTNKKPCTDDPTFRYKKHSNRDCKWVNKGRRARTKRICKKKVIRGGNIFHQCEETCGRAGIGPCKKQFSTTKQLRRTNIFDA